MYNVIILTQSKFILNGKRIEPFKIYWITWLKTHSKLIKGTFTAPESGDLIQKVLCKILIIFLLKFFMSLFLWNYFPIVSHFKRPGNAGVPKYTGTWKRQHVDVFWSYWILLRWRLRRFSLRDFFLYWARELCVLLSPKFTQLTILSIVKRPEIKKS